MQKGNSFEKLLFNFTSYPTIIRFFVHPTLTISFFYLPIISLVKYWNAKLMESFSSSLNICSTQQNIHFLHVAVWHVASSNLQLSELFRLRSFRRILFEIDNRRHSKVFVFTQHPRVLFARLQLLVLLREQLLVD